MKCIWDFYSNKKECIPSDQNGTKGVSGSSSIRSVTSTPQVQGSDPAPDCLSFNGRCCQWKVSSKIWREQENRKALEDQPPPWWLTSSLVLFECLPTGRSPPHATSHFQSDMKAGPLWKASFKSQCCL